MPWHPCVNSRDTITQDDGLVLQNFVTQDSRTTVTSHCRTQDGTWIAWFINTDDDTFVSGYNDISTYTGNDFPVRVGFFPDDGSAATVYELPTGYIWDWHSGGRYSNVNPCFIHNVAGGLYFGNNVVCELVGWNTSVQDVQVRTDGVNVWVVILAQESVMYPWLSTRERLDRCGLLHFSILKDAHDEGLLPGIDGSPFLHDTTGHGSDPLGGTWWQQSSSFIDEAITDDAGPNSSFRWQPMRITVWGGDLGGFTNLGSHDAQFFNTAADDTTQILGLSSGVEAAASPSEPGILHTLWSEAGAFGQFLQNQGERVSYVRWDTAGEAGSFDLGLGWTAEMILRNDHGSPAAIILPWEFSQRDTLGVAGQLQPPEYWDLTVGAPVQQMDASLYLTEAESGLTAPIAPGGGLLGLASPPGATGISTDFHRRHFASSIYTDPTYTASGGGGADVYIVCVGFRNVTNQDAGLNGAVAFYRIPCDGSQPFDYMDGTRLPMYSVLPVGAGGATQWPRLSADFASDPGNVWMPVEYQDGGAVLHLIRSCERTWELLDAFTSVPTVRPGQDVNEGGWVSVGQAVDAWTSPPTIVTDDSGNDWLAGGGIQSDLGLDAQDPVTVAALRARICRCCVPCIERIGLHIWEKV